jgi:hypothetical protein
MRTFDELIDCSEPAWRIVQQLIAGGIGACRGASSRADG